MGDEWGHYHTAERLRKARRWKEASEEYRIAIRLGLPAGFAGDQSSIARAKLASCLVELGELDEAIGEYRQSLATRENYSAQYGLGRALYLRGDLTGAVTALECAEQYRDFRGLVQPLLRKVRQAMAESR